jgi:hypothetical protein
MKTYKDIYKLPLSLHESGRSYDDINNFVFQFKCPEKNNKGENIWGKIIDAINGETKLKNNKMKFFHNDGTIYCCSDENKDSSEVILIRGWGNLTGAGAHNLSPEEAANIQDTFAEFIVEQLNKR